MSPLPANDEAPPVTLADLLTQADDLQRQIDAVEAARAVAIASRLRDRFAVMEALPHPVVRVGYFPTRTRRALTRIKRHAIDFAGLMLAGTALLIFAHFGGQS